MRILTQSGQVVPEWLELEPKSGSVEKHKRRIVDREKRSERVYEEKLFDTKKVEAMVYYSNDNTSQITNNSKNKKNKTEIIIDEKASDSQCDMIRGEIVQGMKKRPRNKGKSKKHSSEDCTDIEVRGKVKHRERSEIENMEKKII